MKYLAYLVLSFGFFVAQAQDKVFSPVEKKAEVCQLLEGIQSTLSCEGENCPPLYESAIPVPLQIAFIQACSFHCVAGEQLCDETLNPDNNMSFSDRGNRYRGCDKTDTELKDIDRDVFNDEDGIKHIIVTKTYQEKDCEGECDIDTCEEVTEYVEVCNENGGGCNVIELYSEEWNEYQRQQEIKAYEKSCFIPTEEDCKNIENEMGACMLDITKDISQMNCAPSTGALWRYRKHRSELVPHSIEMESAHESKDMEPDNTKED